MFETLAAGISNAGVVLGTPLAFAAAKSAIMGETTKGKAWVDAKGMALSTFDMDKTNKSNCNGKCAVEWPPLKAVVGGKASSEWKIVKRADGSKMWVL